MIDNEDPIWAAVLSAEDNYGDDAEDYARSQANVATKSGDMLQAAVWDAAAHALHVLHSINRTWARPRADLSSRPRGRPSDNAD